MPVSLGDQVRTPGGVLGGITEAIQLSTRSIFAASTP
jgi:hypothetical protein